MHRRRAVTKGVSKLGRVQDEVLVYCTVVRTRTIAGKRVALKREARAGLPGSHSHTTLTGGFSTEVLVAGPSHHGKSAARTSMSAS